MAFHAVAHSRAALAASRQGSQTIAVPSSALETTRRPPGLQATDHTCPRWPKKRLSLFPVAASPTITDSSWHEEAYASPSGLIATL